MDVPSSLRVEPSFSDLGDVRARSNGATKVPAPAVLRTERRFALFVAVAPFLGVVAAAIYRVMTWTDLAILVSLYALTGFGITVGYHRLFTHGSFACKPWLRASFAIAGSMALQGPVIRWVADHRRHHAHSDESGDPHSPHAIVEPGFVGAVKNLFHAHMGWFFAEEKTRIRRFAPDLLADGMLRRIDALYLVWVVLSFALPFAIGGLVTGSLRGALTGLLFGGLVRIFLIHHVTWSINSICHFHGSQPYRTRDRSRNVAWLAIFSLGESWHNNHHAFPTAAVHGFDRHQLDPSGVLVRILAAVGALSELKMPTETQRVRRRRSVRDATSNG
jgi:stearoyl-CoA desaturase (delta-9 desaturase)